MLYPAESVRSPKVANTVIASTKRILIKFPGKKCFKKSALKFQFNLLEQVPSKPTTLQFETEGSNKFG